VLSKKFRREVQAKLNWWKNHFLSFIEFTIRVYSV